tara:strand:+ start:702 stop:2603 length:1902 start_codon:yes stop_codon:yes gene_type:complete
MINQETTDKIFETAKIEEVVGDFVNLKKKGVNYIGNCPFHNEKTPSFTVSPIKGIFKCFGCGKGGNAIKFIMEIEHYSYPEALKFIAKKYHIEVVEQELTEEQKVKKNKKEQLYMVAEFAKNYFKSNLYETEEGRNIGFSYFKERGFSDDIIKKFELGYNNKENDGFTKNAMEEGFDQNLLIDSGVSLLNEKNQKFIDRFRERVIFPIHSFSGRTLGFGARTFNPKAKAKYLNSPESIIYYKSKILYGLFQSKNEISKKDNCFIVEGYTDVISMHQCGVKNVVSASGTALGIEQLRLISRITNNITLLFDGDEAGIKATFRTIDLALKQSLDVCIVIFPKKEDPDSYSKKHSNIEFQNFLENNRLNFIDYKIKISKLDSQQDPRKSIAIKRDIFRSIANIPDSLIRSEYCKKYSKKLAISELIMLKEISHIRKKVNLLEGEKTIKNKKEKENKLIKNTTNRNFLYQYEKEILRIIINYGNEIIEFDQEKTSVLKMIINDLDIDKIVFTDHLFKKIYDEIKIYFKEKKKINTEFLIKHEDEEISNMIINLFSERHSISKNWHEQHKIFTGRESHNMRKTTEKAILSLKKSHLDLAILKLQENINNSNEQAIMKKISDLTQIRTHIAKILGRNIG